MAAAAAAAAAEEVGVTPRNLCRKWSRLKTRPQPPPLILMKSSRFIWLSVGGVEGSDKSRDLGCRR